MPLSPIEEIISFARDKVMASLVPGAGNRSADPQFVDAGGGDLLLGTYSVSRAIGGLAAGIVAVGGT